MKRRITAGTISAIMIATQALAETQCVFASECFEDEACAETTFALAYSVSSCPPLSGPKSITAETDFGSLDGLEVVSTCGEADALDGGSYALQGDGATYLLSVAESGARLTVHMSGPISVTYLGTCEGVDP